MPADSTDAHDRADASHDPSSPRKRLSKGLTNLWMAHAKEKHFDVVIVGSGYGGSVAAEALSRWVDTEGQPLRVCVLERGNEYLPGEFPARLDEIPTHLRRASQDTGRVSGNASGLLDFRMGDDVMALVANGVGGGSLINAGVMLEPKLADFRKGTPLHDLIAALQKGDFFERAQKALGSVVDRDGQWIDNTIERHPRRPLAKTEALRHLVRGKSFEYAPITVAMDDQPNAAGVELRTCTLCGDCMTGCNVGAKDSLDANLLELASRSETLQIYSGASVVSIVRSKAPDPQRWIVRVVHTDPALQARELDALHITADKVILSAGTFGSTEILLRSRNQNLVFSPRVGQGFSCNGDNLAAVFQMATPTESAADEDSSVHERHVGPTITGYAPIDPTPRSPLLQEFAVPGAMKWLFQEAVTTGNAFNRLAKADRTKHGKEPQDFVDPAAVDSDSIAKTLLVGVIGHDDARGVLYLPRPLRPTTRPAQPGTLAVRWPDARWGDALDAAQAGIGKLVDAIAVDGRPSLVANPMWRLLPASLSDIVSIDRGPVLTVHPLGGCSIGSKSEGVVNSFGQVYDHASGPSDPWFGSLVVLDGSILPGSLGVNPSLTITATAMRSMEHLREEWRFEDGPPHTSDPRPRRTIAKPAVPRPAKTRIEIVERLSGLVHLRPSEKRPTRCIFELTLAYEPVDFDTLSNQMCRSIEVAASGGQSRLRIFSERDWEANRLRVEPDSARDRYVMFEATVSGTLRFFHREPSGVVQRVFRSGWAWLRNRGGRDVWQRIEDTLSNLFHTGEVPARDTADKGWFEAIKDYFRMLLRLTTRAGEVRRFDYDLTVGEVRVETTPRVVFDPLVIGSRIRGHKRFTYDRRANPWNQLMRLTLDEVPGLVPSAQNVLTLDTKFLAKQSLPLMRFVGQENQVTALRDLASFGMFFARLLINIHLWTFRKPDRAVVAEPERMPGRIAALLPPDITELVVDRMPRPENRRADDTDEPVIVRLTRYQPPKSGPSSARGEPPKRPLVLLHGYSVSGNTFTHPSLKPSAVEYFCSQGREVWVVDLRTSTALPTCSYPWSMERVALIDIPAALLHVANATQQPVDVLAHCIGCVMLSMAVLTDACDVADDRIQMGVSDWLTSEQLGTLAAFNQRGKTGEHRCLYRIVLSQKGPLLRYTESNIFRAYLMQSLRGWLMRRDYQFKPPHDPGLGDQLLDRFLSSLPYPDDDYDVENPLAPWKKAPWTATRHRMDALYGRDFNAANLSAETLGAIDDLFGIISFETVAQTMHFAQFNAITNQRGRGEFVTMQKFRDRWGSIPTLAIHGNDNGLIDVATQDLLSSHLVAAGVPFVARPSDQPPYDVLGHQDVLIGKTSEAVFADIEKFLAEKKAGNGGGPGRDAIALPSALETPWVGPRMLMSEAHRDPLALACRSSPVQGDAQLLLVPARLVETAGEQRYQVLDRAELVTRSTTMDSTRWMVATPRIAEMKELNLPGCTGWLALILYLDGECVPRAFPARAAAAAVARPTGPATDGDLPSAAKPRTPDSARKPCPVYLPTDPPNYWSNVTHVDFGRFPIDRLHIEGIDRPSVEGIDGIAMPDVLKGVAQWMNSQDGEALDQAFVRLDDLLRADRLDRADEPEPNLQIAVASCQYPPGLMDRKVAGTSLDRLAAQADGHRPTLALFIGDQVYADATAGIADPVRKDELFEQPNEKALRLAGMRAVLRRLPARTLLDDHELSDNWAPLPPLVRKKRPMDQARNARTERHGFDAWKRFQLASNDVPRHGYQRIGDYAFRFGGYPFYFADTRTGRSARGSTMPPGAIGILQPTQWTSLERWLVEHESDRLKFIATPSLFLPRHRPTADDPAGSVQSDAWDGFKNSQTRLIQLLVEHAPDQVVLLSGDEHYPLVAEIDVFRRGTTERLTRIVSIHASALYAPFPFANGHPQDIVERECFELGNFDVRVATQVPALGDGYALLTIGRGARRFSVDFGRSATGEARVFDVSLPDPIGD